MSRFAFAVVAARPAAPGERRGADDHGHDPQPVPRRRPLAGDRGARHPGVDRRRRQGLERAAEHEVRRARDPARARDQGLQGRPRRAAGGRAVAQADAVRRRRAADQPAPGARPRRPPSSRTSSRCCARSSARPTASWSSRRSSTPSCPSTPTPTTPPAPARSPALGADFDARLTMRDVILVRKGSKVKLGKTRKGHFKTRYEPNVGGIKIPVDRGWTSVEARVGKQKFRFVNTHLEAFGDTAIREAQAQGADQGPAQDQGPGRARRRPQLGHRPPQRAGEAGRRPRLPRAGQVRPQGQRRGPELLLSRASSTRRRSSTTRSTTCSPSRR